MEKKNKRVLSIMIVAVLLIGLAVSTAYFVTNINNEHKEVLEVQTGTMKLIFDDNSDGMKVKSLMLEESVSKELRIQNTGTLPVTTNLNWKDLTNTYLAKSLSYKVQYKTAADGTWVDTTAEHTNVPRSELETEITILKDITIPKDGTYYYKITITFENTDENQDSDRNAMLATKFNLGEYFGGSSSSSPAEESLEYLGLEVNETPPTFGNAATTDEGLFAMEDNYGTSYYYRGAVTNNYVKFGGFYWRIIRINGDGSLRMIYDGTSYHANGESNADRYTKSGQPFNANHNDAKYLGYMFGGTSKDAASTSASDAQTNTYDSAIKEYLDIWYENNILTNAANSNTDISKYLADSIFCNDRTIPASGETWSVGYQDSNLGWAKHETPYGAYSRFLTVDDDIESNPMPTFKCSDNMTTGNANNDRFTVSDTELGNGDLKYPIGLITADEVVAAGSGKYGISNRNYYLYKGASLFMWLLSPALMLSTNANAFCVANTGGLDGSYVSDDGYRAVAPVINLKAEYVKQLVKTSETGNPYQIPGVA